MRTVAILAVVCSIGVALALEDIHASRKLLDASAVASAVADSTGATPSPTPTPTTPALAAAPAADPSITLPDVSGLIGLVKKFKDGLASPPPPPPKEVLPKLGLLGDIIPLVEDLLKKGKKGAPPPPPPPPPLESTVSGATSAAAANAGP